MVENKINDILLEREKRINRVKEYLPFYNVCTIKANVPGLDKNLSYCKFIIDFYKEKVCQSFNYKEVKYFESVDGNYYIVLFDKSCTQLKKHCVDLEEKYPIGRLVDIDIYYSSKSESRDTPRKCLICDENAVICTRKQTHSTSDIINKSKSIVCNYLAGVVYNVIKESMYLELNLHPKFGLVTPFTNGSHKDMNYTIMESTIDSVCESIKDMFVSGYLYNSDDLYHLYEMINKRGLEAEEKMYSITNGINTYKGLIFDLGLISCSLGIALNSNKDIFKIIGKFGFYHLEKYPLIDSYSSHNIKSARMEAMLGFPVVQETLEKFKEELDNNDYNESLLLTILIYIITKLDDTVLLKRSKSINRYYEIKKSFSDLLSNDIEKRYDMIKRLDEEMIKENISFGGCADTLICVLFLSKIKNLNIYRYL